MDSGGKQFSTVDKTKIKCWHDEGVSNKEIASRMGRHPASIRKVVAAQKDRQLGETPLPPPPPQKRSGRPRWTTVVQEERLRRHILRHPFKTAKQLKRDVAGWSNVSVRTIQRVLNKRLDNQSFFYGLDNGHTVPLRSPEAPPDSEDGGQEDGFC